MANDPFDFVFDYYFEHGDKLFGGANGALIGGDQTEIANDFARCPSVIKLHVNSIQATEVDVILGKFIESDFYKKWNQFHEGLPKFLFYIFRLQVFESGFGDPKEFVNRLIVEREGFFRVYCKKLLEEDTRASISTEFENNEVVESLAVKVL